MKIILVDLFSGIGGFAKGLFNAGFEIEEHYFSEIDNHAIANYKYNFPNAKYVGSILNFSATEIRKRHPKSQIIVTFGWPCQDNSIAGKRKGQRPGTRSGLLFEAGRIIKQIKPSHFIAENVKGLYSVNQGVDFYEALNLLTYLDSDSPQYTVESQLLNTSWILPQNRERIYFVGHSRKGGVKRIFPVGESDFGNYERTTEAAIARTLTAGGHSGGHHSGMTLIKQINPSKESGGKQPFQQNRVYDANGIVPTLCKDKSDLNISVINRPHGYFGGSESTTHTPTLNSKSSRDNLSVHQEGSKVRRLTEIECERLQGFPPNWTKYGIYEKKVWTNKKEKTFEMVEGIHQVPKTQRYKMCGNAVTVAIVELVAKKLLNLINHD